MSGHTPWEKIKQRHREKVEKIIAEKRSDPAKFESPKPRAEDDE